MHSGCTVEKGLEGETLEAGRLVQSGLHHRERVGGPHWDSRSPFRPPEGKLGSQFLCPCVAAVWRIFNPQGSSLLLSTCTAPEPLEFCRSRLGSGCTRVTPDPLKDLCRGHARKLPLPRAPCPIPSRSVLLGAAFDMLHSSFTDGQFGDQLFLGDLSFSFSF